MTTTEAARKELLLSQLLTLHFDLAIKRYKDPPPMSKFAELASMTRDTLTKWDAEADDLVMQHHKLEAEGNELFQRYRATQARKREDLTVMRDAIRDLSGANLPNEPEPGKQEVAGSQSSSGSFPTSAADHSGEKVG